jgi:hypothetical protein
MLLWLIVMPIISVTLSDERLKERLKEKSTGIQYAFNVYSMMTLSILGGSMFISTVLSIGLSLMYICAIIINGADKCTKKFISK